MQIEYDKNMGLRLYFPKIELKVALGILKAIYALQKLSFVKEAIDDLEIDLRPRLTMVSHYHFCLECMREIDDRDGGDNYYHYENGVNNGWKHRECPPFKESRPV